MKQLLLVSLFTILLTAFTVQKYDSEHMTQMVMTLPGINSIEMQRDLEEDIHNLSGIQFIEISLRSKTLILNYDARKLSLEEFSHILHKWGFSPGELTFLALDSMK